MQPKKEKGTLKSSEDSSIQFTLNVSCNQIESFEDPINIEKRFFFFDVSSCGKLNETDVSEGNIGGNKVKEAEMWAS